MKNSSEITQIWAVSKSKTTTTLLQSFSDEQHSLTVFDSLNDLRSELILGEQNPDVCIIETASEFDFPAELSDLTPFETNSDLPMKEIRKRCSSNMLAISNMQNDIDFLIAPFTEDELSFRINILKRKNDKNNVPTYIFNAKPIRINPNTLTVQFNNFTSPTLTSREFQIINILCTKPGSKIPVKNITDQVWDGNVVCPKTLHVHVHNLRKKIRGLNMDVIHSPPKGYCLVETILPSMKKIRETSTNRKMLDAS